MPESEKQDFIGFPPPLLGERPWRLPVLFNADGLLILDAPAGVLAGVHDWYGWAPNLADAIGWQAGKGKNELRRLEIGEVEPVFTLEPELTGAVLLTKNSEAKAFYRNQDGSLQMCLCFCFVALQEGDASEAVCDLPLVQEGRKRRMTVSHREGKSAQTLFTRLEQLGRYSLWEARTHYCRTQQIRVHALECGLQIPGDGLYSGERGVFLSQIKSVYRPSRSGREERPLYEGLCLHLGGVEFQTSEGESIRVEAPLPKKFGALLKLLRRHSKPCVP